MTTTNSPQPAEDLGRVLDRAIAEIEGHEYREDMDLTLVLDSLRQTRAVLAREREALEKLYIETERPYAVYGDPALSTMEQLVRFENARIEAARVIGPERIKALLAQPPGSGART